MASTLNPEERARKEAAKLALSKPSIPAAEQAIADAQAHNRAAEEAAAVTEETKQVMSALPDGYVKARVLRAGHDKIYTGQTDGSNPHPADKFTRFKFGDIIAVPGSVAYDQELAGRVEVLTQYRAQLGLPLEE